MNGIAGVAAIVAKQQAHARHAPMLQTATALPQAIMEMSVAACFEAQVLQFPQHTAVVAAQGTLTYQELNLAANRLAHHLVAMGVAIGTPVAIILEQSLNTAVSIWGVVKAGGCYFCLEPSLPVPRMQDLLQRSATQTIITSSDLVAYVEQVAPAGSHWIVLDRLAASELTHNPGLPISPHDPLAINFTSGSTGTPKVTSKSHVAQLYSAWQCTIDYQLSPADRHTSIYQLNAGLSSRSFFTGLLTGGAYYIYPGVTFDMSGWATWLEASAITQLSGPTAAIRELMYTRPDGPNFPAMRMVQVAGQTVYRQDAELFQRRFAPGAILVSLYGMTETATITHYLVDHDTRFEGEMLPIGYPVAGRQLFVIDEAGKPLIDQPGELVLRHRVGHELLVGDISTHRNGSPGADNDAAEGVAKDDDAQEYTLFHTSDIGIQRPDGCLTYLGRKDDMVKVRGHRVTLMEIESWLLKINGVAQAAAKAFPTANGDNRIIGYVALAPGAELTEANIRAELNQSIPFYMVPARVVVLSALPMTTTGKVDRKTLPPPDATRPPLATPYVAPRNASEQQIAELWATMLGIDEIGVDDNFFELGGDSMNAVRMVLTIEAKTGATVPQGYFRAPTVAALAILCAADANPPPAPAANALPAPVQDTRPRWLQRFAAGEVNATNILRTFIRRGMNRLSYSQGIAWLKWWTHMPLASYIFRHQRQLFLTFAHEMATPAAALEAEFATSLLGNLIRGSYTRRQKSPLSGSGRPLDAMQRAPEKFWRTFAQQFAQASPGNGEGNGGDNAGARFHVRGLEHLEMAQKEGRGTIMLTYHSVTDKLGSILLAHHFGFDATFEISSEYARNMAKRTEHEGRDNTSLASATSGWAATYALEAQRILQQNGMVRIANDFHYDEPNSFPKTIGQRHYSLKPGFAELALTTGATILPYYSTFDNAGGLRLTVLPALTVPSPASNSAVHALLDQYVAFLEATWQHSPSSLSWWAMYRYRQCPRVNSSV